MDFGMIENQRHRNVATINSLEEFLDTIHTHLDELWRLPYNYPQNRMVDLMDIICEYFWAASLPVFSMESFWIFNIRLKPS